MDARLNKVVEWVESLKIGDSKIVAVVRDIVQNLNMAAICQRLSNFVEETVLLPYEEMLNQLVLDYPELTRIVYRYGQVPIRKVKLS